MGKMKYVSMMLLLACCSSLFAQNLTVNGTVVDASVSEPLIGASVTVKGTMTGTITDVDGGYSLSVPANAVLVFSYVGYEVQEIAVNGRTRINVALQDDALSMEEVVVVGAIMKKSDLTGAVGSVSAKTLSEKPVTNINQALQGRVAGVFVSNAAKPGGDSSIKIRGINTINGSTDPIYVVDGLVMDNFGGGFNSINVNDVASIEVLKDASATALYGSRASNGVIVVTTKKGAKGEGRVNYDAWYGVQTFANTPKTMSGRQLFELRRDAAMNSFDARYPNATETERADNLTNRIMNPYIRPTSEGGESTGGYVFAPYELDAYANGTPDSDWLGAVTRDGIQQNHLLNFSGGDDKSSYYLSFGYADQKGLVKNLNDTRYTGRINADRQVKTWLKVGTNTSYARTESDIANDDGVFDKARGANPMLPVSDEIMTLNYGDFYDQNYFNPIRTMNEVEHNRTRDRIITANFIQLNPIEGLIFRTSFSADIWNESRFRFVPNDIQESIRYGHGGEASHDRDRRMSWQWDNSASYEKRLGLHKINGLFATSASNIRRDYTSASAQGFDDSSISYYNLGASTKTDTRGVGSDFVESSLQSYLIRANYDYAGRYLFTATARYDGSSKFAEGNRWGLFPSFSGAWNVTEESFMRDQNLFNQLKLRAGFGRVGNQNIEDYAYYTLYSLKKQGEETAFVANGRRGTKDLTWESQNQSNLGLDMAFLKNRIRISMDAFLIENKDLLMIRSVQSSLGFIDAIENVGEIENKGVEFSIDAKVIDTQDFQWNLSANISKDKNTVTKLYADRTENVLKYDADRNLQKEGNLFIGESRNTIYIWKTGGIAQEVDMERFSAMNWAGRSVHPGDLYPLDSHADNVIDDKDRVIVGSPDPKFYGGFSTDLTYKGITLNAVFSYSYGAKKLSPYYESLITSVGKSIASVDLTDRWTPTHTEAKFPRPILNDPQDNTTYNTFSASQMDHSVQDASFLRLSTLSLSYTLPANVVNQLKLDNLRVYTTASNLFCITPYKGYDPETGDWYPPTRMVVLGLNLSF